MFRIRSALLPTFLLTVLALPIAAAMTETAITLPITPNAEAVAPDGTIWILSDKGNLGKLPPGGTYTEFIVPWGTQNFGTVAIPYAQNLTTGIDGNVWLLGNNGHVARVTPAGAFTDFTFANANVNTSSIVSGADGALWFFDQLAAGPGTIGSPIWKMTRVDIYGQVTTYDLGISGDNIRGLVSGGDGSLWFLDATTNQVVKFSLVTKSVAGKFAIPTKQTGGYQTVLGWDGNVWFTYGTFIDRVKPDGKITEFPVPSGGATAGIAMVGDGNIWFTEPTSGKLGQLALSSVTSSGQATIVETDGLGAGAYQLFVVPPPSGTPTPSARAADITPPNTPDPCKSYTMKHISVPPPPREVIVEETIPDCWHVKDLVQMGHISGTGGLNAAAIVIGGNVVEDAPPAPPSSLSVHSFAQSGTVTAVLNLTAAPGVTISGVSTDPSTTASFSGLSATLTKNMSVGSSFSAVVSLTPPPAGQPVTVAGAVTVSSTVPDADPTHHTAAVYLDLSSLQGRHALSPNTPNVVITPVKRGK